MNLTGKFYATSLIASIRTDEITNSRACTRVDFMARCMLEEMKKR